MRMNKWMDGQPVNSQTFRNGRSPKPTTDVKTAYKSKYKCILISSKPEQIILYR